MRKYFVVGAVVLGVAGCAAGNQASSELTQACNVAMSLAPLAGPISPWIIGGCGTFEAVNKLAQDPSSLPWVNGLIAKVKG